MSFCPEDRCFKPAGHTTLHESGNGVRWATETPAKVEVDHAKRANEYIDLAEKCINGYEHLSVSDLIALAQVHATLALKVTA